MTTRFYLHAASSTVSGTLPSTKQSTLATTRNFDVQTVNRIMDTTIGASQSDITASFSTTSGNMYMSRFVSAPIYSSPTAQTWTLNFAAWRTVGGGTFNYPAVQTTHLLPSSLYVWRPSTGALVGYIFDSNSATGTSNFGSATTETTAIVTFTGSAVTIVNGDVLCFEAMTFTSNTATQTTHYAYDGTTANTTDNTSVSNHASFIETPDTIAFAPTTIDCTVTTLSLQNKFITKI